MSPTHTDRNSPYSEGLQREWLRWLAQQWAQINQEDLSGQLRAPIFRVGSSTERLGAWIPTGRVLEVQGEHLATSTAAELEYTLRHEMAHQIVSELLASPGAKPHGTLFHKACGMLGVAGGPADTLEVSPETERVLRKTRKLLSLASSSSTSEAAVAMARAQEILAKYNLDMADIGPNQTYGFRWLGHPQGRIPLERKLVAEIIQEFFFVRCVWIRTSRINEKKGATVLEVFGRPHNLEMASYVYDCLMRHLDDLWADHRSARAGVAGRDRRSFRVGVIMGFHEYLASLVGSQNATNLVWARDPSLQEFISARHPRLVRSSGGRYRPGDALEAGKKEGKRLRIQPGVTKSGRAGGVRAALTRD